MTWADLFERASEYDLATEDVLEALAERRADR